MKKNKRATITSQADVSRIRLLNDRLRRSRLMTVPLKRMGILQNVSSGLATNLTGSFEGRDGGLRCGVTVSAETEQTSLVTCNLPVGWSIVGVLHADWYLPQVPRFERTFLVPPPPDLGKSSPTIDQSSTVRLTLSAPGTLSASSKHRAFDEEVDADFQWNRDFTKLRCEMPYDESLEGATVRIRLQSMGMDRQRLRSFRIARLRKHGDESDPILKCVVSIKKPSWSLDGKAQVFIEPITDNDFAQLPSEASGGLDSDELNVTKFLASQVFTVRVPKAGGTQVSVPNSWLAANSLTIQVTDAGGHGTDQPSLSSRVNEFSSNASAADGSDSLSSSFELFRTTGKHENFEAFWICARPMVFRNLLSKVKDTNIADDVTQEVSLKLLLGIPKLEEPHVNPTGYVLRVAANTFKSWLRKERMPLKNGKKRVQVNSEVAEVHAEVLTTGVDMDFETDFSDAAISGNRGNISQLDDREQTFVSLRKTGTRQDVLKTMGLSANEFRDMDHRVRVKLRFLQAMSVCDRWRESGIEVYDARHADAICRKVITGMPWPQVVQAVISQSTWNQKDSAVRKSMASAIKRIEHVAAGLWLQHHGFLQPGELELLRDWLLSGLAPVDVSSVLKDSLGSCAEVTTKRLGTVMHGGLAIWQDLQADRKGQLKAAGRNVLLQLVLKNRSWDEALSCADCPNGKGNRRKEDPVTLKERVQTVWNKMPSLVPVCFRVLPE